MRGDFKKSEYGGIILPLVLLRRLDSVLEPTRKKVAQILGKGSKRVNSALEQQLKHATRFDFYNKSPLSLTEILQGNKNLYSAVTEYMDGFSRNLQDIFEMYDFGEKLLRLYKKNLLGLLLEKFVTFDLSPQVISNSGMGMVFEQLIRIFAESSTNSQGEHITPKDIVFLLVQLVFRSGVKKVNGEGKTITVYDPCVGTGGLLTGSEDFLKTVAPDKAVCLYGQELNDESLAICRTDLLIRGHDPLAIKDGNTLTMDEYWREKFDFMVANPPFGMDWKKVKLEITREFEEHGQIGRFNAGLPKITDGALLFVQHLISKMKPKSEGGSRIGVILNGSPLFAGGVASGESAIRRFILESDLLETVVRLPTQMFQNTTITTFIWVLANSKPPKRRGKVQLIDASKLFRRTKRHVGTKKHVVDEEHLQQIVKEQRLFKESDISRIVPTSDFGYCNITIDRPSKNSRGEVVMLKSGKPKPDTSVRTSKNIPLTENVEEFFQKEVLPFVPDAWYDPQEVRVGYEIHFSRFFFKIQPTRSLEKLDKEIQEKSQEVIGRLQAFLNFGSGTNTGETR